MSRKDYPLVRNMQIARFFYQGTHTHPVRRTVVLIESKPKYFRGYEVREGAKTYPVKDAPIKTYTKRKISKVGDLDKRRTVYRRAAECSQKKEQNLDKTTLYRQSLVDFVKHGA